MRKGGKVTRGRVGESKNGSQAESSMFKIRAGAASYVVWGLILRWDVVTLGLMLVYPLR